MNRSKISNKTILGICSSIANNGTIQETAKTFNVSVATVENIIRGIKSADVTGISTEDGCHGVDYLRENKDIFTEKYNSLPEDSTPATQPTARKKTVAKAKQKAKAKQVSMVIGKLNLTSMLNDTTSAVMSINKRMEELNVELKQLEEQKAILMNVQMALSV